MSSRLFEEKTSRRDLLKAAGVALIAFPSVGALLEACAGAGSTPTGSTPTGVPGTGSIATAATGTAATSGKIRFRVETGEGGDFQKVIDSFKPAVPGIDVELTQVDVATAGVQWHVVAIQNGLVDLLSNENPKFLYLDPLLKANLLLPLDAYSGQYGWQNQMIAEALKRSSRDGKLWTLPLFYEYPGIAYRKSTLAALGVDVPKTYDDFVQLLQKGAASGKIALTVGHRGFSQIQMLHYMFWGSIGGVSGPGSIEDVIFGSGKFTDAPCVKAAQTIADLYKQGLIDKDAPSITQDDAAERFIGGKAAFHVTGTWFYSEMKTTFGDDWDMFTAPGPGGAPVWCSGETEAMVIPSNSKDPGAAARFLDFCVQGDGAKVLRQEGNVLASKKYAELAIPQVQHLPCVTGEKSSLLIFGWLPQRTQDAHQQGLGGVIDGSVAVNTWAQAVQTAWEKDIADGNVPANRASIL